MGTAIIYIQANDEPGIVSTISKIITNNKANIETSKMINLSNIFNLIMLISVENDNIINIEKELSEIEKSKNNFFIKISKFNKETTTSSNLYKFSLKGADTEGLVYKFTDLLSSHGINVENMDTEINNAPITGHPLFFLTSIVNIPNSVDIEKIKNDLNSLADKSNVAIKLKLEN